MENDATKGLKLGWSDFAARRHLGPGGHTWFQGTAAELLDRVREGWPERRPGSGRSDLSQVVIVPVAPEGFVGNTVTVHEATPLQAALDCRQEGEDPFIRVTAEGPCDEVEFAFVVMYSARTLMENGGLRSGDYDWEVVCLLAQAVEHEPMDPLTMARNYLEKPGGTFADYSAREFAEAIYYWSRRAIFRSDPAGPGAGR